MDKQRPKRTRKAIRRAALRRAGALIEAITGYLPQHNQQPKSRV